MFENMRAKLGNCYSFESSLKLIEVNHFMTKKVT